MDKSPDAFRTISEAAEELDVPQHVLRFWETRFNQLKPMKRGGGRRYYRPDDMELLRAIRHLLYGEGYTIRGVQRMLKQHGVKAVAQLRPGETLAMPVPTGADGIEEDGAYAGEPTEALAEPDLPGPEAAPVLGEQQLELLRDVLEDLAEARRLLRTIQAA
jgi:DNA-binding transcriptional MerR regulator